MTGTVRSNIILTMGVVAAVIIALFSARKGPLSPHVAEASSLQCHDLLQSHSTQDTAVFVSCAGFF